MLRSRTKALADFSEKALEVTLVFFFLQLLVPQDRFDTSHTFEACRRLSISGWKTSSPTELRCFLKRRLLCFWCGVGVVLTVSSKRILLGLDDQLAAG